jgi:hypothetical protein
LSEAESHGPALSGAAGSPFLTCRRLQVALGLIWLLDAALQYQPFMFGRGFATDVVLPSA